MSNPKVLNAANDSFYGSYSNANEQSLSPICNQSASNEPTAPQCDTDSFRNSFVEQAPSYCECARVTKRPLSWAFWSDLFSSNRTLDAVNAEFSHSHITFDQSGDNIGFGPHGLFAEDMSKFDYRAEPECYDGTAMRRAIADTEPPTDYYFVGQNCQTYVERVLTALRKKSYGF